MPKPAAVIWDVDGTLVDTAELHFQSWVELAKELDKPFSRADFAATFGQRNPEIIPKIFGISDTKRVDELGRRKEDLYRAAAKHGVAPLPGVATLLEGLHEAGFRQAIGSSAPRENVDLILELTETARFFAGIVSMEDTQRGKPDPQVFLLAAGKVGIDPARCLVIEDAPAGIQAARAGGMKSIGVTFVGHHSDARLKEAGADLVVQSLEQVSAAKIREILGAK
jgi:beta-phosphoglucomutase